MNGEYLQFATVLAYEAGEVMKKYFGQELASEMKADDTIVTIADHQINQLVIDRVKETYPDHDIDGEEQSHRVEDADHVWVCDPIDGTNPFAMELPLSVFSLALVVDGKPVIGVIYHPFTDKLYAAEVGKGATVIGNPIRVSTGQLDASARMNFDWWPRSEYDVLTPLKKLSALKGFYMLSAGSTTHASALVARGEFVASVFPGTKGKNVDVAAAKVIVEEAGGKVTDLFGNDQRYNGDIQGTIMSNGVVHDELVQALKEVLR